MEKGAQNQQKKKQNSNNTINSISAVNNFQGRNRNANYQQAPEDFTRYPTVARTISTIAFALTVAIAGAIATVKFAREWKKM